MEANQANRRTKDGPMGATSHTEDGPMGATPPQTILTIGNKPLHEWTNRNKTATRQVDQWEQNNDGVLTSTVTSPGGEHEEFGVFRSTLDLTDTLDPTAALGTVL